MGEAKRRRELGLPPKGKKENKSRTNKKFSWSKISINKFKNEYPAAPFVTTAILLIVLQFGFSLSS